MVDKSISGKKLKTQDINKLYTALTQVYQQAKELLGSDIWA